MPFRQLIPVLITAIHCRLYEYLAGNSNIGKFVIIYTTSIMTASPINCLDVTVLNASRDLMGNGQIGL